MSYQHWQEAIVLLPEQMREGVTRYINDGILPGAFCEAVFANDFLGICSRADWVNKQSLYQWAEFLYLCPPQCHGNYAKVETWSKTGGLNGISRILAS